MASEEVIAAGARSAGRHCHASHRAARPRLTRQLWVVAHRWAGLTIALFLAVAGFTGIFLAFLDELEGVIAPEIHHVAAPAPGMQPLDPVVLADRVRAAHPGMVLNYVPLDLRPGRSAVYYPERRDAASGRLAPWSADYDELFVDPYTGRTLGARRYGDLTQGAKNLMPFLYRLHYSLALGEWGMLAFGVAALIWTIDCFVGFYLTWPVRATRRTAGAPGRGWLARWRPAWRVRWPASAYKVTFDLHRAGGLWIWPLLLVFAWSSVAFNLTQVYTPVMQALGAHADHDAALAALRPTPAMDTAAAAARGAMLARTALAGRGMTAGQGTALIYRPATGLYSYRFTSGADFTHDGGWSQLRFDGDSGEMRDIRLPRGDTGADTFTNWIMALHMGRVFGLPYRIAVSVIGALVTMLSVTGVLIWMKKRTARLGRARSRAA